MKTYCIDATYNKCMLFNQSSLIMYSYEHSRHNINLFMTQRRNNIVYVFLQLYFILCLADRV